MGFSPRPGRRRLDRPGGRAGDPGDRGATRGIIPAGARIGSTAPSCAAKRSSPSRAPSPPAWTSSAATPAKTTGFSRSRPSTRTSPSSASSTTRNSIRMNTTAAISTGRPTARCEETRRRGRTLRYQYAALLSMCDHYLGQILNLMDALRLWDDTMLIVCTDHGFLLGEHDWWAKNNMPLWTRSPIRPSSSGIRAAASRTNDATSLCR